MDSSTQIEDALPAVPGFVPLSPWRHGPSNHSLCRLATAAAEEGRVGIPPFLSFCTLCADVRRPNLLIRRAGAGVAVSHGTLLLDDSAPCLVGAACSLRGTGRPRPILRVLLAALFRHHFGREVVILRELDRRRPSF